jgi:hypothetical protein
VTFEPRAVKIILALENGAVYKTTGVVLSGTLIRLNLLRGIDTVAIYEVLIIYAKKVK